MVTDYSYIGSGKVYLRNIAGSGGLLEVGNCAELKFSVDEEVKELKDYMSAGGGTLNEVRRIKGVSSAMKLHNLSPENLALALRGDVTPVVAGSAVDEVVTAKLNALVPLAHFSPTSVVVKNEGKTVTYDAGDDYEAHAAGLFFPSGSTIAADASLKVSYSYGAQDVMEALTQSAGEYELMFDGLNEARTGKPVIVQAWRVRFGASKDLSLIGDDYAVLEVEGKLLKDTSKTAGKSQYFKATLLQ